MKRVILLRKPLVRISKDNPRQRNSKEHFHVLIGKSGNKYVSVSVTHSPSVAGHSVKALPDNLEKSYFISDSVYVRDSSLYRKPMLSSDFDVSSDDWREFRKVLYRKNLKVLK